MVQPQQPSISSGVGLVGIGHPLAPLRVWWNISNTASAAVSGKDLSAVELHALISTSADPHQPSHAFLSLSEYGIRSPTVLDLTLRRLFLHPSIVKLVSKEYFQYCLVLSRSIIKFMHMNLHPSNVQHLQAGGKAVFMLLQMTMRVLTRACSA